MKQPSTSKQRQLIKIMQKKIGIDDDVYRDMLQERFKVRSSTELSYLQAGIIIDALKKNSPGVYKSSKGNGNRVQRHGAFKPVKASGEKVVNLASVDALDKVNKLSDLIEWRVDGGIYGWMRKRFKIKKVRTAQEAFLVTEGLKKMFENQMKKKHGDNWKSGQYTCPEIRRYIVEHTPSDRRRLMLVSGNKMVSTKRAEG